MRIDLCFSDLLTKTVELYPEQKQGLEEVISRECEKRLLPLTGLKNCYCHTYSHASRDGVDVYSVTLYSKTGVPLITGFAKTIDTGSPSYA